MKGTITPKRLDCRLLRDIFLDLLPGVPPPAASLLSSAPEPRHFAAGDLIIREKEPSMGIFLLTSGVVQTAISKRTSEAARQLSLQQIAAPAVLGLTAAMLEQLSPASIVSLTQTQAAFIHRVDFLRVLGRFPHAGLAVSQVIASELAQTYAHLTQLRGDPCSTDAFVPVR